MQPLTKKAKAAIELYVQLQGEKYGLYLIVIVRATLKADRMSREELYSVLNRKGYIWKARVGRWIRRERSAAKPG